MERVEEQAVIRRVLRGETEAFAQLVTANQEHVYRLAIKIMKNEADAMDVSQDVFLKAFASLRSFRGECRFSVWLYQLTCNTCTDYLRKSARLTSLSDAADVTDSIPDPAPLPHAIAEQQALRLAVYSSLQSLSPHLREVILLREYEQLSYEEIADRLKLPVGTVRSRIARGRKALAEMLVKNGTIEAPKRQTNRKEGNLHG